MKKVFFSFPIPKNLKWPITVENDEKRKFQKILYAENFSHGLPVFDEKAKKWKFSTNICEKKFRIVPECFKTYSKPKISNSKKNRLKFFLGLVFFWQKLPRSTLLLGGGSILTASRLGSRVPKKAPPPPPPPASASPPLIGICLACLGPRRG